MDLDQRIEEILHYWFGHVEETALPSEHRTQIWFGHTPEVDQEIKEKFSDDFNKAIHDEYKQWENSPRGCLALIILLDQFPRHLFRREAQAFSQDQKALSICLQGIERQHDHMLSLIERVFFYFPLMHSENLEMQALSIRVYQMLLNLSFPETRGIFEKFLDYAVRHYETIRRFGRFPHRNEILARPSTDEEVEYLKNSELNFGS